MTLLNRLRYKICMKYITGMDKNTAEFNVSRLSPGEYALYQMLLDGFTTKECIRKLQVDYMPLQKQTKQIYKKLGVRSQAELIVNYRNIGLDRSEGR